MKVISMVPISCRVMRQDNTRGLQGHQHLLPVMHGNMWPSWKALWLTDKDCALLSLRLLRVQVCSGHATALQADQGFHLQQSSRAQSSGEAYREDGWQKHPLWYPPNWLEMKLASM